jgi:hypothetical protein
MSLEFEYRRLAAVCLDLAKRATLLADRTRLLLIAEAWFDLADRVTRNEGNEKRRNGDSAERPLIASALGSSGAHVAAPSRPNR